MRILKKELWPYKVTLNVNDDTGDKIYDIEIWLDENLGSFKNQWRAVYTYSGTDFYFRQGRDATMFALRWS